MVHTIQQETLEHSQRLVQNRYRPVFNILRGTIKKSRGDDSQAREISDIVDKYARLFSAVVHSIEDTFGQDSDLGLLTPSTRDDFLVAYSANIAAKTVAKDLEASLETFPHATAKVLDSRQPFDQNVFSWGQPSYSTVKLALEGMVKHAINSGKHPLQSLKDYFSMYANLTNRQIRTRIDKEAYDIFKDVKWKIGNYELDGLTPIVIANNGTSTKPVAKIERTQFYTPFQYLHLDKSELLPRSRIVGDQNVITYLERMVRCLFMYDPKVGKNPMKAKKKFQQHVLLAGMPGSGKGKVNEYLVDFAEQFNEKVGSDLMVTQLEFDSSFMDGSIQKLKSQFRQVGEGKRIFVIYQDEIDQKFAEKGHGRETSNNDVIKEMQKFMQGQYENKGNYLILAATNQYGRLPAAIRSRFYKVSWQGAVTPQQKGTLFKYKLEPGAEAGYVPISNEEYAELGKLAHSHNLSGRDVDTICKKLMADAFRWDNLGKVWGLRGDYDAQLDMIDQINNDITFAQVQAELKSFAANEAQAKEDSLRYEVA